MADEDNNRSKILNELSSIKTSLTSTNPMTTSAIQSKLEDMKRNNPNLAPEIANLIKAIEQELSVLKEREAGIVRAARSQEAIAQESEEIKKIIEHQHRLQETKVLQQEYDSFKDDFVKKLQNDNALLRKAANSEELTEEEKARLTRTPRNEAERLEFEKLDKEQAERWKKHYQLKDNYGKLIKHGEKNIKKHQQDLKENSHLPKKAEEINGLIDNEQKQIAEHRENLQKLKLAKLEREEERKILLDGVRKGTDIGIMQPILEKHYDAHFKKYEKALEEDPNHRGALEFREILQKTSFSKDVTKTKKQDLKSNNPKVIGNKKNAAEKYNNATGKDFPEKQENGKETSTIKKLFSFTRAIFSSKTKNDVQVQTTTQTISTSDTSQQSRKSYVNAEKFSPEVALETERRIVRLARPNPKSVSNQVIDEAIYQVQSVQLSSMSKDGKENKIELHSLESKIKMLNIKKMPLHPLPTPKPTKSDHRDNNLGR